jgi:hypothetical protein
MQRRDVSWASFIGARRRDGHSNSRGVMAKLCEKSGGARAIGQRAKRAQGVLGAARQSRDHVIGIDTDPFELGDELSNYLRVRHPTPVWGRR